MSSGRAAQLAREVLPQCLLAQAAAFVAWQSGDLIVERFDVGKIEIGVIGFLVAFLLIFKTQTSYKQFWTAFSQVDGMLQINRILARGACTLFDWKTVEVAGRAAGSTASRWRVTEAGGFSAAYRSFRGFLWRERS